ncbi:hypothetical protein [Nonomuraea sp. NPDC048826]|uniref:hypothetical protein n=1 Tax=Nonomuraea sp. NPDC048826 TaxID=3364347 RepID=UPI003722CC48
MRWSDTSTITLLTGQPGLPDAWWRSLPMPRVLAAIGPESLGELLTEIVIEHWPAAAVGDVLPALHMLDPDEADEPYVAIALDRAGSWPGLLALTGRELMDQPFVQARPVLTALFSAALVRLSPAAPVPSSGAATLDDETPLPEARLADPADEAALVSESSPAGGVAELDGEPVPAEAVTDGDDDAPGEPAEEPEDVAEEPENVAEHPADAPEEPEGVAEAAEASAEDAEDADDGEERGDAEERPADAVEHPEDAPEEPEDVAEPAEAVEEPAESEDSEEEPADAVEEPEDDAEGREADLPQLIEAAFAHLDDKSWAVAQNRVFTDQPSAVDQLAKLFAVPPAEIAATEDRLRAMLDEWLASDEAAPYRAHLEELREKIGPAAPKESLINAADWHGREIKALEVPAWQFVLATLPDRPPLPEPGPAPVPPSAFSAPYGTPPEPAPVFTPKQKSPKPLPSLPPGFMPPDPVPSQFQAFAPAVPVQSETNGSAGEQPGKPYQPLKDVSQTRRCFRQPDGRWWLRVDVTAEQLGGGECALPTGFAAYLGLSPGETRTVRSAAGELTMTWHGRPVLESIDQLLSDVGAKEGGHLFLTLSDEGVLRARHLPVAAAGAEQITKALRLVGYTAPGGTRDQAARVIATRIGMTGPVHLPDLLTRLRERGDRDLLELLD